MRQYYPFFSQTNGLRLSGRPLCGCHSLPHTPGPLPDPWGDVRRHSENNLTGSVSPILFFFVLLASTLRLRPVPISSEVPEVHESLRRLTPGPVRVSCHSSPPPLLRPSRHPIRMGSSPVRVKRTKILSDKSTNSPPHFTTPVSCRLNPGPSHLNRNGDPTRDTRTRSLCLVPSRIPCRTRFRPPTLSCSTVLP